MKPTLPKPSYTIWQAIAAALSLAERAINEVRALARMPGPQGPQGERGKDGFNVEDLTIESPDGGRTLEFTYRRPGRDPVTRTVKTFVQIYRGIWREGQFEHGDTVTRDGSLWVAMNDTATMPGTKDSDWQLCAKRGRDGKDAR